MFEDSQDGSDFLGGGREGMEEERGAELLILVVVVLWSGKW